MTVGKGKRPRDPNQLAKWIVDRSTSDAPASEEVQPTKAIPPVNLSEYMAAIGRKGRSDWRETQAQDDDQSRAAESGSEGR